MNSDGMSHLPINVHCGNFRKPLDRVELSTKYQHRTKLDNKPSWMCCKYQDSCVLCILSLASNSGFSTARYSTTLMEKDQTRIPHIRWFCSSQIMLNVNIQYKRRMKYALYSGRIENKNRDVNVRVVDGQEVHLIFDQRLHHHNSDLSALTLTLHTRLLWMLLLLNIFLKNCCYRVTGLCYCVWRAHIWQVKQALILLCQDLFDSAQHLTLIYQSHHTLIGFYECLVNSKKVFYCSG